ncbi:L-histidine N(alpha)-methyltransferase [Ferruginivarius sediminum]|nr:L-histidine N(alpha)-methyltransferase [Ferruginivarius sediminum]
MEGLGGELKSIPSKYYYDNAGSILFELQCKQPEYYLTRTEEQILRNHADEIVQLSSADQIVELGSGSSLKTKILIQSHQNAFGEGIYIPNDINHMMIKNAGNEILEMFPNWQIRGKIGTFLQGISSLPDTSDTRLFLFLGSTIGNMTDEEISLLLSAMSQKMGSRDVFLVGVDLEKEKSQLEAAYNDGNCVAALTNLNTLSHLNWRFDGNIRVDEFDHQSFYNASCQRMESHVLALEGQCIKLRELDFSVDIRRGETIRTEIMRKFPKGGLEELFRRRGFEIAGQWCSQDPAYGVFLFRRVGAAGRGA